MQPEKENILFTEGDVNFSALRKNWYKIIDSSTLGLLEQDAEVFIHQSLSTPCLDVIESCEGIYIKAVSGKRYMDFHGNSVHQVGYRNQYVMDRVKQQMDVLPFSPRRFANKTAIDFAQKLTGLFHKNLNRVLFAPGGTSAVGMALKLARVITGKYKVVSWADSFHGASMDAIAAGGEEQFKKHMGPLSPETINIPQPAAYRNVYEDGDDVHYAEELENILKHDNGIGAFIAETIRNTDVQIPSAAYWQKVREICTRYNVLLILDEIPIAFGRTGKMFAFEHYDFEPDIVCLGKGLGAGIIPIAAIITKDEYNVAADVSLGHYTHEKSPLGCAAGQAMIEFIEQHHLLDKVKADELYLKAVFAKLATRFPIIGDIRGIGLLWGIELVKNKATKEKAVQEAERMMYLCLENGLSFKVSKGNVLQLCPPLIITREELETAIKILEKAFEKL
ncbi:aspartate aminotransferase family protein [Mucilaginibacter sp.]|uniref:aspartate aminotransferase family protein n=1 Tax=Mucilaginibacter sp. TaxID=1882438 RepID=UPI00284B110F|nr:aspartate aminotransferase family protein [Mucilaginibacter sp.]MDR3697443.1 aspartate aminotransferase family protein [Mucilaginibacter sp.]